MQRAGVVCRLGALSVSIVLTWRWNSLRGRLFSLSLPPLALPFHRLAATCGLCQLFMTLGIRSEAAIHDVGDRSEAAIHDVGVRSEAEHCNYLLHHKFCVRES